MMVVGSTEERIGQSCPLAAVAERELQAEPLRKLPQVMVVLREQSGESGN